MSDCAYCGGAGNVRGEPCKPCDRTGRADALRRPAGASVQGEADERASAFEEAAQIAESFRSNDKAVNLTAQEIITGEIAESIAAAIRDAALAARPAGAPAMEPTADEYDELRDENELRLFEESARLMGWPVDRVPEVSGSAPQFSDPATFAAWWGWRASARRFRRGAAVIESLALTEERIEQVWAPINTPVKLTNAKSPWLWSMLLKFARAIESAHGIERRTNK